MELTYRKMDSAEVDASLAKTSGWSLVEGKLTRGFEFKTYKDGVVFASAVAFLADQLNHHPDILIGYSKVNVSVNTHDVGGISPYDFELAQRIDRIRSGAHD